MCRCETVALLAGVYLAAAVSSVAQTGVAQTGVAQTRNPPAWKHVAGYTIQENLAGPASGPVLGIWYASNGNRLLAVTVSNRIFETSDFEHWRLNTTDSSPAAPVLVSATKLPESGARVQAGGTRLYALSANNIYSSEDFGRTWLNLTGFNGRSILGGGFTALAVSPSHPDEIAAANQFGVWRSLDGGLSWHGINDDLPNLPIRSLPGKRMAALSDGTVLQYDSGVWTPGGLAEPEAALRQQLAGKAPGALTAAARSGGLVYAGTADGRLLSSRDGGATWLEASRVTQQAISRIWQDSDRPDSALAAAGAHLLRTVNGGQFWDDVTGSLPSAVIHGIAADRSASVVYLATDRGVYQGSLSLNDAGSGASDWKVISAGLPAAAAWDVRLNSDNTLTAALDGYGVFETPAPHQTRNIRLVNGADLSDRAAAPGSLISVLGASVRQGSNGAIAFPVIAAGSQSSQLQVPFESSAGIFSVFLQSETDRWSVPLTVKDASPAIFVDADGSPLILDGASGFVMDSKVGIHAGSSIQVMATGLGKVSPDWPTGVPAPLDTPPAVRGTVAAYLDGVPVQVTRSTLAPGYVGYYLVELQIPSIVNKGASELRIVMNGEESNRVKLYLDADIAQQ